MLRTFLFEAILIIFLTMPKSGVNRCLPLLVSPMIPNLKVRKMLVDGGAGLNLISPKVISKLQILDEELKVAFTFQEINPGRSRPKGKITLPVTFGGELNYRTEKIVFDVV
jgi:hypothetical protein